MTVAIVSAEQGDSGPCQWMLTPDTGLVFGGDAQAADLVIPHPQLPDVMGRVAVARCFWTISNFTVNSPVLVENLAGNDFVSVRAGTEVPVPFTSSRVLVCSRSGIFGFSVCTLAEPVRGAAHTGARPDPGAVLLDRRAKYFVVLVALCEPALRYGPMTAMPTSAEIVRRLRRLPSYRSITSMAVDFHLNYLCTQKLKGFVDTYFSIVGASVRGAARNRRAALVQLALRFDLVRRQDLSILDG